MSLYQLSDQGSSLSKQLSQKANINHKTIVTYSLPQPILVTSSFYELLVFKSYKIHVLAIDGRQSNIVQVIKFNEEGGVIIVKDKKIILGEVLLLQNQIKFVIKFEKQYERKLTNIKVCFRRDTRTITICGYQRYGQVLYSIYKITEKQFKLFQEETIKIQQLKANPSSFSFNVSSINLYIYSLFAQKMKPVVIWKIPEQKHRKIKYEMASLYNNYTVNQVQEMHDEPQCIVLACNRYAYGDKDKQAYIWVYNVRVGYTRIIIDLKGYIDIVSIHSNNSLFVQTVKEQKNSQITYIDLQYFNIFSHELPENHRFLTQNNESIVCLNRKSRQVHSFQKYNKKVIYHKILLQMQISMNMMDNILALL